jgi:hypothetical protein
LGPLPSTACFCTWTSLLPVHPSSDWLRLILSQTFSYINTQTFSSRLFLQRHALTLAPRRVSPLSGWHGSHSHVPQADAARQLLGALPHRPSTVVERLENRHKCFQEQRNNIRACRTALHPAPTSNTLRGTNLMGRNLSLSGGNPR